MARVRHLLKLVSTRQKNGAVQGSLTINYEATPEERQLVFDHLVGATLHFADIWGFNTKLKSIMKARDAKPPKSES